MEVLEARLKKILEKINGEVIKYSGEDMIEDGILDSLEVMQIITEIENEFEVEMTADDIVMENFKTMETIGVLVKKRLEML